MDNFSKYPLPDGSLPPELQDPSDDWDAAPTASPFVDAILMSVVFWGAAAGLVYWVFFY